MQYFFMRMSRYYTASSHVLFKTQQFFVCLTTFFLLGLQSGAWVVLLADLTNALGVDSAQLGVALTSMAGAGVITLVFGGKLADLFHRRVIIIFSLVGTTLFFGLLSIIQTYSQLLVAFAIGGLAISFFDLIANTIGGDFERQHSSQSLTFMHASWSLGASIGALFSGIALWMGSSYVTTYLALAIILVIGAVAAVIAPLPAQSLPKAAKIPKGRVLENRGVLLAALLIISTFSVDAGLEGYVSLYLRRFIGSGALAGGVSVALLYGAAVVGRLVSGIALRRFGEQRVVLTSGLLTLTGLLLVTVFTTTLPVAFGLLLVGLALSPLAPVAYSQAAHAIPERAGQAASAVTVFGYTAFLVVPVIVGSVAEAASLRLAFTLLLIPVLGIIIVSRLDRH
jgi:MFS family permease